MDVMRGLGEQGEPTRLAGVENLMLHFTPYAEDWSKLPVIVSGEGSYVTDDKGRSYIDGLAGLFTTGDGVEVGPLIEPAAIEKVERHVEDARRKGAMVALGGWRIEGPGNFFAPTVLRGADDSMLVAREETFGPVAAVMPFDTEEEVVRRANDTAYGLAAYYFTRDVGRVFRLAEELEYGPLGANDGMSSTDQTPSGGLKESGFGREGGCHGVEEYLDLKCVSMGGIRV